MPASGYIKLTSHLPPRRFLSVRLFPHLHSERRLYWYTLLYTMAGSHPELSSSFKPNDYYDPDIQTVQEPVRTVLEKYSRIPSEKIVDHVNEVVSLTARYTNTSWVYADSGSENGPGLWYVEAPSHLTSISDHFSSPIPALEGSGSLT